MLSDVEPLKPKKADSGESSSPPTSRRVRPEYRVAGLPGWGFGPIRPYSGDPKQIDFDPPVEYSTGNGRHYWVFRDLVYSTTETLTAADVKALALEAENKVKARLSRARALMAQVDVLEHGGREPIPDDVKMFVWQRDGGKCVRCGSNRNLEYAHIIPVSMGGANTARNLQLLCEGCNRAKAGSLV